MFFGGISSIITFLSRSNMILFEPENVAGHAAYYQAPDFDKTWISSSTLIAKYRLGESLLDGVNRISGNGNIAAKINISDVIKKQLALYQILQIHLY